MEFVDALRSLANAEFLDSTDRQIVRNMADICVNRSNYSELAEAVAAFATIVRFLTDQLHQCPLAVVQSQMAPDVTKLWDKLWILIDQELASKNAQTSEHSASERVLAALLLFAGTTDPIYAADRLDGPSSVVDLTSGIEDCLHQRYVQQSAFLYLRSMRRLKRLNCDSSSASKVSLERLLVKLATNSDKGGDGKYTLNISETPSFQLVKALDASAIRNYSPAGKRTFNRLKERMLADGELSTAVRQIFDLDSDVESGRLLSVITAVLVEASKRSTFKFVISKRHRPKTKHSSLSFRTKVLIAKEKRQEEAPKDIAKGTIEQDVLSID